MSRVFVVQEGRSVLPGGEKVSHNYDTAHEYGALTFLIPARRIADAIGKDELTILEERLSDFKPDDYIIFSGDASICALAGIVAYTMLQPGDKLRVLKWDREARRYMPSEMRLPEID